MRITLSLHPSLSFSPSWSPHPQLAGATIIDPKTVLDLKGVDHCCGITTAKGRTYYISSDRADIMREWLSHLRTAIAHATRVAGGARSTTASTSGSTSAAPDTARARTVSPSERVSRGSETASLSSSARSALTSGELAAPARGEGRGTATSLKLPGSRSAALSETPVTTSLTSEFQRLRQRRPARPRDAQDQDKLAQRVYNLLYKPR